MTGLIKKETFAPIETRFVELVDKNTFAKEVSFAIQHATKNKQLQKCTKDSVLQSVMNVAQVGLTLNPVSAEAYLIPRWVGKDDQGNSIYHCVLEPSYQGLVKLVTDTGSVENISCYAVFLYDEFEVSLGTNPDIKHIAKFKRKEITHVYAIAQLPGGQKIVEVMTIADCYDVRDKSESYKAWLKNKNLSCPWIEWEQEMCRKCCIKRIVKYLPKSKKWEHLREAISLDNNDYDLDPIGKKAMYLGVLIENAAMDDDAKVSIEKQITDGMTIDEANKLINNLKEMQLDPIADSGGVGGEKEIAESVRRRVEREK